MDLIHEQQPGDPFPPTDDWRPVNEPPLSRGHPVIAWVGIIVMCTAAIFMQRIAANVVSADEGDDPMGILMMQIQARHLVASGDWLEGNREALYGQAEGLLNIGSVGQRQRFVILAAELAGVEEAREALAELQAELVNPPQGDPPELTEAQAEVQELLQALYGPEPSADDPGPGSERMTQ